MRGYVVVFEGDEESGFSAYCPDLLGVTAVGETRAETETLMRPALAGHIALLRRAGFPIPGPAEAESVTLLDPAAAA
jgi:predicted RNase H-like HicB family nuclease